MGAKTEIQWTEASWNPIRGCTRVSAGCQNCYAERVAMRFSGKGQPYEGLVKMTNGHPQWTGKVRFVPEHLHDPLKWKAPRRIFVNSMSDLFHEGLEDKYIAAIFMTMAACAPGSSVSKSRHIFQVLTKRPRRMLIFITKFEFPNGKTLAEMPLPNVWLGVSCEDQKTADERIPLLLQTPAAVRWVSAEPLLGPIDLHCFWPCGGRRQYLSDRAHEESSGLTFIRACACIGCCGNNRGIDWLVAGGESGPGARPMHPDWARSLRDQCQAAGVPFFFKQWGEYISVGQGLASGTDFTDRQQIEVIFSRAGKKAAGRLLDGREWNEYPEAP